MRPQSNAGICSSLLRVVRGMFKSLAIHLRRRGRKQSSNVQEPDEKTKASISNRSLPLSTFITMLKDETGKQDVGVGSIRTTLFHHFGEEASPKIKKFVNVMVGKLRHDGKLDGGKEEAVPSHALREALLEQDAHSMQEVYAGAAVRVIVPRNGVLVSGCQTDETSADATTPDGTSYGALSNAIQAILGETNRELVVEVREMLSKQGYTQQPGLYCSDDHAKLPFIC
jgi:hypothetical protein